MSSVSEQERRDTTVTDGFNDKSWDMVGSVEFARQLVTGDVLADLADDRDDIVVCTADLGRPTRVYPFKLRHPQRYFNFGIAERNMVSAAAGMAASGLRPFVSGYGAFLAVLASEQIRTDVAYPQVPVRLIGTHSGVAMGFYGTSHHATEDISILRGIADLTVLSAADGHALRSMIHALVDHPGPLYIRTGRGREPSAYDADPEIHVGGSSELRSGDDVTVIATGVCTEAALRAAETLADEGTSVAVVDAYSLKPFDGEAVARAAARGPIVTAEEHNVIGGLGSIVADEIVSNGLATRLLKLGLPDEHSLLGPPTHLHRHYGIDGDGIADGVRTVLGQGR